MLKSSVVDLSAEECNVVIAGVDEIMVLILQC